MNADTKVRPLTVGFSTTNTAWELYNSMMPMDKIELANKFDGSLSLKEKQTASVNYIEDNMAEFA